MFPMTTCNDVDVQCRPIFQSNFNVYFKFYKNFKNISIEFVSLKLPKSKIFFELITILVFVLVYQPEITRCNNKKLDLEYK